MNRVSAIQQIGQYFDQDEFFSELSRRVKVRTERKIQQKKEKKLSLINYNINMSALFQIQE